MNHPHIDNPDENREEKGWIDFENPSCKVGEIDDIAVEVFFGQPIGTQKEKDLYPIVTQERESTLEYPLRIVKRM